ncbi:MAG: metallophosphoesterase family protein [Solirubrobacterales bacterium]
MNSRTLVAIVSDTHMPRGPRRLPDRCLEICSGADLIVHAGDLSEVSVLGQFEAIGPPVSEVFGNVDSAELRDRLPARLSLELGSVRLGIVHDAGARKGRLNRMRALFPGHDAVVFGHSHLPLHEADDDFQIFNPGSPTERRHSPFRSMGVATVTGKTITFELIDLGT